MKKGPGERVPGAFFVACVTSKRSDLVAERALDLALQILGFALALLRLAFGAKALVIGRLAGRLLRVAGGFVGEAFRLFGEFTHGVSPCFYRGVGTRLLPNQRRASAYVPLREANRSGAKIAGRSRLWGGKRTSCRRRSGVSSEPACQ